MPHIMYLMKCKLLDTYVTLFWNPTFWQHKWLKHCITGNALSLGAMQMVWMETIMVASRL